MASFYPNRWAVVGTGFFLGLVLCRALASAEETKAFSDYHPFERSFNPTLNTGFLLSFVQNYYQTVETSLQEKSYFELRYYLASPSESFDNRLFFSENPTQTSDLAWRALHSAFRQTVEDIELVKIARAYINALTNLQMVIGPAGAQLHGPSLTELGLPDAVSVADPNNQMILGGGLTFADDFRLGLMLTMKYRRITSKLRYYPLFRRNEFVYTAETQLTAATKIGLSYRGSQDGGAVMTTLSFQF
jgi:hypothetical protein